jgi:DHA1 family bicyclomycin/chloramphenicol resistance-like MFS transporter
LNFGSWRWIFGFLAVYGAVLIAAAAFLLRESLPERRPGAARPGGLVTAFMAVFGSPASRAWAAVTVLAFGTLTIYLANASAVLMDGYGLSPSAFGAAFAVIAVFAAAGNLLNSRLARTMPLASTIRGGLLGGIVLLVATAALDLADIWGVAALVAGLALFFVTFGLVVANATSLAMGPHGAMAGAAAAALGFTHTLLAAVIASLVVLAYDGTALPMIGAMALLTVAAFVAACAAPATAMEPSTRPEPSVIVRQP